MMIRRFVPAADLEAVMAMAEVMHHESPVHSPHPFSHDRVYRLLMGVQQMPECFAQVAYAEDDLVGFSLVMVTPMYFSEDLELLDFAFYVDQSKRGTLAAIGLVRGWEAWAKQQGAVVMRPGVSTGINDEQAGKFLERLGYRLTGRQYSKIVASGS